MADPSPTKNYQQTGGFTEENLNIFAYMFAGLAMMLNIRLSYSAAPYALLRFKLPENLFSVFVRTTSSALELWCLPSMLLGNIMEQVYNHTQEIPGIHSTGITVYAEEIKNKTNTLKSTASSKSNSELTASRNTDIKSDEKPQDGLQNKANDLKGKAQTLHDKAKNLETAAKEPSSPLAELSTLAGQLKEAAKKETGSGDGLFKAAETLATIAARREKADTEATNVITAFDKVEIQYNLLMKQAKAKKLTSDPKVSAVELAFHDVKTIYYQMLIVHRIKKKATEFHRVANKLQTQAALTDSSTLLGKLNEKASGEMTDLVRKASTLKGINVGTAEATIVQYYLAVENAYKTLMDKVKEQQAEDESLVKEVTKAFDPLKNSYENVLRLRVQELAKKGQKLNETASALAGVQELGLQQQAEALRDAASGGQQGLKEKADALVTAIKGTSQQVDAQANGVIDKFEDVRTKYNALMAAATGHKENDSVKTVETAYTALKDVYDPILNFAKLAKIAQELYNAVDGNANAENVITNFNSVVDSYNALGLDKPLVQSEFENLQEDYSNAIYFYKKCIITIPSMFTNWLNFLTFVILLIVYVTGGDQGSVTGYYWVMAISGFVFGINMVLVYAVDYRYLPYYIAGENSFPIVTSAILYVATSIFGNRRKYNSDYLVVLIDISISIFIALVASVLWTVAFKEYRTPKASPDSPKWPVISPALLVLVGMGLVYSIYPGIAPGMIVPFYLIDKIEMVLLILTTFPPLIFAFTTKYAGNWSPKTIFVFSESGFGGWKVYTDNDGKTTVYGWIWHLFDILAPLQIILAVIFVYSIHYRDSSISRSIVNQPKMSTFLTIIFYMCHEIMLATGFPGLVCNGGVTYVLLPTQWVGALLMVLLAFYSIGYITEYKRHDPSQWPTEGMTKWNALCYWLKMASKITNKNFKQLFTTDLRRDLLLCIQKNELI